MKLYAACMNCLLSAQVKNLQDYKDEDKKAAYMKELMRIVADSSDDACAPWLAAQIAKTFEKYFGKTKDYAQVKSEYNQLVMKLAKTLQEHISLSEDPLMKAMLYARVGNYIDFSAVENIDKNEFVKLFERDNDILDSYEYEQFIGEMRVAKNVVYLLDNCGELVLDQMVIRILQQRFPDVHITAVVRGAEVINDATMEDAIETGLTDIVEVIDNGDNSAGTILTQISEKSLNKIKEADLIIAKGQGNFESLNGCGLNIYYLFLCKCEWFMKQFNVPRFHGMFVNERRIEL